MKNAITCAPEITLPAKWFIGFCCFVLLSFTADAQSCPVNISNNTIQIRPATCAGTVATLQGSNPSGGTGTYTYQWQRSIGNCGNYSDIPGATFRDYAVPPSTATNDCFRRIVRSGTCSNTSSNIRVDSDDRTTPAAPTTTAVGATCLVATGIITVTSPTPATGISYSIDGLSYTNVTGIFTGVAPGTYSVTAKFPAGCVSPPQTQIVSAVSPISGSISPSAATFCAGDSQVLTVTGGNSYQWYKNNVPIAGATSNQYTAKEAGIYTADIIVGVCNVKASNSVTVTVNPLPSGTISPTAVTICAGNSTTLTATGGTSYQWYRNASPINGATGATIPVNQQATYTVDIINNFGCKAKASNSSEVTVAPMPTGTISPSTDTLCNGNSILLTVAGGGNSYQWYKDGIAINNATDPTYSVTTPGTYTVDITSGSCTNRASNSAVITQISQSATISPANATLCPGGNRQLTVSGATGTFQWYRDNQLITSATTSTYTATQPGTYTVTIVNGSCTTQATNPAVVSMGVNPSGVIIPATASICPGSNVTLTAIGAGGGFTYQWSRNGQSIPGATTSTYIATQTGNYNVSFSNGTCTASAQNIVAVSESAPIAFNTSTTHIECTSPAGSITVGSVTGGGASVYRYSKDNGANFQTSATFPNLAAGTYQIVVRDTVGCVSAPRSVAIQQNGFPPTLSVNNPPRICPDQAANLGAPAITAGSDTGLVFTYWSDTTATTALANPGAVAPGKYYIKATNRFGCAVVKPVTVTAHTVTPGTITPAAPPVACFNTPVELQASNGTNYQWYRNDTLIVGASQITYKALLPGEYAVVINNGTCLVPAGNKVNVTFHACIPDAKVFVPTAFTPNKNGTNDVLRPILYNIAELKYFKVYNRWGQEVFQTKEIGKGWDGSYKGSPQPSETYSWILEGVGKNGDTVKQSGRSLLIR